MIWTEQLRAAALAIARERGRPWYAPHIERRLKERAFDLSEMMPGRVASAVIVQEVAALRKWLDPYEVRPSHAAFNKAWNAAARLQAA